MRSRVGAGRRDQVLAEGLTAFVRRLNDAALAASVVVVEGPRDEAALRGLGYVGPVFQLSQQGGVAALRRAAPSFHRVILLLDYDGKGRALTKRALLALAEAHVPRDLFFRRELQRVLHGAVGAVEELARFRELVRPSF